MANASRPRTNDEWRSALVSADALVRSAAQRDLIDLARRGLGKALAGRADIDGAQIDDFAQETAIRVLNKLAAFRGDSDFRTWALAIGLRLAFTELRRRRWKDVSLEQYEGPVQDSWPDGAPSPEAETHRVQIVKIMYRIINHELTPRQRLVLLAELDGVPLAQLADRLDTNLNAIYKLGHDARTRLRKAILDAGISAEEVAAAFTPGL